MGGSMYTEEELKAQKEKEELKKIEEGLDKELAAPKSDTEVDLPVPVPAPAATEEKKEG